MKGEIVYLYAFDVAYEIHTERIEKILSEKPFPFEIRMDRTLPKDMPLYRPLAIDAKPIASKLRGLTARPLVRVYDVGVVSITMRAEFDGLGLLDLVPFHNPVLEDGRPLDKVAQELCGEVIKSIAPAMVRGTPSPDVPEAYTVFSLTNLGAVFDANAWLQEERRNVAGLLTETEPDRLSDQQIDEVLRQTTSFESTDMAVIDWDAALVVDLAGYTEDVLYVLELANLQLEELQIIDERLDQFLDRAYDDLEARGLPVFGVSSVTLRTLRRVRVDMTKLTDELTNITKFFGDWYLARVYLNAQERFHIDTWRKSVDRRLVNLDQLYNVVKTEVNEKRMLFLEVVIVLLFIFDIIALFFIKRG